jgi:hypothetical protein
MGMCEAGAGMWYPPGRGTRPKRHNANTGTSEQFERLVQRIAYCHPAVPNALPGDLTVWDGYVAMIVGNGMMVD